VSGNAEAYGFYCESITKSRLFINNSYFSLAAKKNICAIYVKNALTYSISITENSGSLIATGLESTSVVLSLFTFYDLHPKSIYYQNNRFLFSCNYINGRATAIELDPYSNLQDMNFLDGNVFVSSTKDNGYLADRMYVIDYGSL
jgi:hypothetical protein